MTGDGDGRPTYVFFFLRTKFLFSPHETFLFLFSSFWAKEYDTQMLVHFVRFWLLVLTMNLFAFDSCPVHVYSFSNILFSSRRIQQFQYYESVARSNWALNTENWQLMSSASFFLSVASLCRLPWISNRSFAYDGYCVAETSPKKPVCSTILSQIE